MARASKPRRPDPHAIVERDGSSRLYCPHDGASLIRLHGPHGNVFFGCSRYPECDYSCNKRRVAALKREIWSVLLSAQAEQDRMAYEASRDRLRRIYAGVISPEEIEDLMPYHREQVSDV